MTTLKTAVFKPKIDLHRHLLGSIPEEVVASRIEKYRGHDLSKHLSPPQKAVFERTPFGRALFQKLEKPGDRLTPLAFRQFTSLPEFLACYVASSTLIFDIEDFKELLNGSLKGVIAEELDYVEFTISPSLYLSKGISWGYFLEALQEANSPGCSINWLLDPIRDRGPEHAKNLLLSFLNEAPGLLTGVSLAGDERSYDILTFREYFSIAKSHGLGTTAHVGENPSSRELAAALSLPLDRIGHGISAAVDKRAREILVKTGTPLEICLSSNIKTRLYQTLDDHPIQQLLEAGVTLTLNTDDPFFFQTTLKDEFCLAEKLIGASALQPLIMNAEKARFSH